MPDASVPAPETVDAIERAQATRVVVIGGGVAGLVASLEWARIGASVTVLERGDRLGGNAETASLDGLPVDVVADALPIGRAELDSLLDELGLRDRLEPAAAHGIWVTGLPGEAPLPTESVLGIPANPWDPEVRRIIGWRGVWRAYLDRLRPPLTIGHERSLGRLVRTRMGDRVADRLVAPLTRGIYGVSPDTINVEVVAPGLNTALTRTASLSGAVTTLLPDEPAATRASLPGGIGGLVEALAERLGHFGASVERNAEVKALARRDHRWELELTSSAGLRDASTPARIEADVVVIAAGAADAMRLLESAGVAREALDFVDAPSGAELDVVTLVVECSELDAAPRGRAVVPAMPGPVRFAAHVTADWPWLAALAGPGRHVVRVHLEHDAGRRDDDDAVRAATQAAENLFAVTLGKLRAAAVRRVSVDAPAAVLGHTETTGRARKAAALPGVALVGGWLAGAGIAQIIADTVTTIDRQRRAIVWQNSVGSAAQLGSDE